MKLPERWFIYITAYLVLKRFEPSVALPLFLSFVYIFNYNDAMTTLSLHWNVLLISLFETMKLLFVKLLLLFFFYFFLSNIDCHILLFPALALP